MTAVEVTVTCPCCREHIHEQKRVYPYARAYLCELHRRVWVAADANAHRAGCPWTPKPCVCRSEVA